MTAARRHPNVVNLSEVTPRKSERGGRFALAIRALGRATGAKGIGCSHYEIPPGKTAFPTHWHCANEESLYVLNGTGTLRIGDASVIVGPGDYATFPVGPGQAHQLVNTGTGPLRYLCFSTMQPTEVVGYPDSRKIGAMGFSANGEPMALIMVKESSKVDYYEGEI
ncbi:MAG: cupin domain-containing protein [Gammaproteobacteria bacterium]|nr:cupin domain-containing protein [Gammaproteobacteria bacterium]